jgi:hypothetical protein
MKHAGTGITVVILRKSLSRFELWQWAALWKSLWNCGRGSQYLGEKLVKAQRDSPILAV